MYDNLLRQPNQFFSSSAHPLVGMNTPQESPHDRHSIKNRRTVGLLNPMRDKNSRQEPGGRRDDTTCDHGLSRSWKVGVHEMKKEKEKKGLVGGCSGKQKFYEAPEHE